MAVLKQIKFGSITTPIAMTQVAIDSQSSTVLGVTPSDTGLDVNKDPVYTISLAVDGKTIAKGANGLETSLALKVEAASGEGQDAKKARIALVDSNGGSGYAELSSVNIEDIVGEGIVKSAAYDPATGKLTITWAGSGSGKTTEIDLGALLDIDDIIIKSDSTEYLSFAAVNPGDEDGGGQAQIGVKLADVTYTAASGSTAANLTVDTTNGKMLDASDAIPAIKSYVKDVLENASTTLAVTAEGDDYVSASVDAATDNKHVIVDSNVVALTATAGTAGEYGADGSQTKAPVAGTLSGTANSLVDGADVAAKVKTYVDGEIAIEEARADAAVLAAVQALDATVGSTTVDTGKHVAVQVVEENGKLTSLTVTENDIASAAALSDEIARAKSAETAIDTAVGLTKDASNETRTWTATTNYGGNTVKDNMQALDTQLKKVTDDLAKVQYKVSGTTLEFFGISEKTA